MNHFPVPVKVTFNMRIKRPAGKTKAPQKLQSVLFSYYLIIPMIVMIAFSVFFYKYVSDILISRESNSLNTLNSSISDRLDSTITDLDYTSANINYAARRSNAFSEFFDHNTSSESLSNIADLAVAINGTDLKADQINLYDLQGSTIRIGMLNKNDSTDLSKLSWVDDTQKLNGSKFITTPYETTRYSVGSGYSKWYISVCRILTKSLGNSTGYIEVVKKCPSLFSPITNYVRSADSPAEFYVFNKTGELIYPYDISDEDKDKFSSYSSLLMLDNSNSIKDPVTGRQIRFARETSAYSGWTCLAIQQDRVILRPVISLTVILLIVVIVLLLLIVFLSYSLSKNMVKPVKHLKHIIQRLGVDNLGQEKTDNYNPTYQELGELYQEFQKMSESLNTSMGDLIESRQQELKSRSMALQSQTDPHFYYNTLSCIIVLADNHKDDEVIKLCRTLSQLMRYITSSSSDAVTVATEINYINKYLYCMKIRYQSNLKCVVDIDERIMSCAIPKLLIQPIVENAIKYGTDCIPPWTITISGTGTPSDWQITVSDTGNGFDGKAIEMLRSRMNECDDNHGMPELQINGLGMINVYLRWKIYAKHCAIFEFGNTEEGHAFVKIGYRSE